MKNTFFDIHAPKLAKNVFWKSEKYFVNIHTPKLAENIFWKSEKYFCGYPHSPKFSWIINLMLKILFADTHSLPKTENTLWNLILKIFAAMSPYLHKTSRENWYIFENLEFENIVVDLHFFKFIWKHIFENIFEKIEIRIVILFWRKCLQAIFPKSWKPNIYLSNSKSLSADRLSIAIDSLLDLRKTRQRKTTNKDSEIVVPTIVSNDRTFRVRKSFWLNSCQLVVPKPGKAKQNSPWDVRNTLGLDYWVAIAC